MPDLYFARTDNNVAFSRDIINAHYLVTGYKIESYEHDKIRAVASRMSGIVREIQEPSPEFLVKHGYFISAVRVYRDIHDCSLTEAKAAIDMIAERIKEEQ